MEVDLLGPLEVRVEGRQVPAGGARQRAVLALLALSVGAAVPPARMIDSLWDGDPPPTAANTLQVYMSRWRRQMANGASRTPLRTVSGMYVLDLPDAAVDARRFELAADEGRALLHAGDPRSASDRLRAGLRLWRSDSLPEMAVSATGQAELARLEARRLAALADRIDADALLGRHAELVPELQGLVLRYPLDERFVAQLMTALYRDGQQAEALAAYAATADRLVEELGVDPGPALRALHGRVLRQDLATMAARPLNTGAISLAVRPAKNGGRGGVALAAPVRAIPTQSGPGAALATGSIARIGDGEGGPPAQPGTAGSGPASSPESLVGRRTELTAALDLLRRPEVRLVTLLGPGGAGKTRLAGEIARLRGLDRSMRVAFVPLAAVRHPAGIVREICRVLGAGADWAGEPALDVAARALDGQPALLVLDNLEQLVGAGLDPVRQFLEKLPQVTVLATSRAVLKLPGERLLLLGPLPEADAVRLFTERARVVLPGFRVSEENARAVAALCRALDGLPLALELAAARVRVLPPEEILRRLDRRLELLAGGDARLPERQRSMWAALDWSAQLLDPAELRVFGQLSVFAGGWTLDAAEAVCRSEEPGTPVVDVLGRLADKSLVVADGTGRLGMLETVRDYAREVLAAHPSTAGATRDRHADHYAALAERVGPQVRGWLTAATGSPRAVLDSESGNFAAALHHVAGDGERPADGERLGRLVAGLLDHWFATGRVRMADRWLRAARAAEMSPGLRARLMLSFGNLAVIRGDLDAANEALLEAGSGDPALAVRAAAVQGVAARYRGRTEEALTHLAGALERLEAANLPEVDAVALERALENELGEVLSELGRVDEAVALWQDCRRWAAAADNPGHLAYPLVNLARAALDAGRSGAADDLIAEALAAAEASETIPVLADVMAAAGLVDLRSGQRGRAVTRLRRAVQMAHDCGQMLSLPETVGLLGAALLDDEPAVATRLLAASRAWRAVRGLSLVNGAAREVIEKAETELLLGASPLEQARGERVPFGSLRGLTMLDPGLRRAPRVIDLRG